MHRYICINLYFSCEKHDCSPFISDEKGVLAQIDVSFLMIQIKKSTQYMHYQPSAL